MTNRERPHDMMPWQAGSQLNQRGFTLIELILVIVLLGVLAVFAVPRMFDSNDFNARGFHDETLGLLRYAQKTAIAQRRTVCVSLNATGVSSYIFATNPASGNCSSAPLLKPPSTAHGGSGLSAKVGSGAVSAFQFTPLGSTDQSGNVVVSIVGSSDIVVEANTGYVHE